MEVAVHHFFSDRGGRKLSKRDLTPKVEKLAFAPDIQKFFEEIPDRQYEARPHWRAQPSDQITRPTERDGGLLQRRETFPRERKESYRY